MPMQINGYTPTVKQMVSLERVYYRDITVAESFEAFCKTCQIGWGSTLIVEWKKMFLCIEPDGHTHS